MPSVSRSLVTHPLMRAITPTPAVRLPTSSVRPAVYLPTSSVRLSVRARRPCRRPHRPSAGHLVRAAVCDTTVPSPSHVAHPPICDATPPIVLSFVHMLSTLTRPRSSLPFARRSSAASHPPSPLSFARRPPAHPSGTSFRRHLHVQSSFNDNILCTPSCSSILLQLSIEAWTVSIECKLFCLHFIYCKRKGSLLHIL